NSQAFPRSHPRPSLVTVASSGRRGEHPRHGVEKGRSSVVVLRHARTRGLGELRSMAGRRGHRGTAAAVRPAYRGVLTTLETDTYGARTRDLRYPCRRSPMEGVYSAEAVIDNGRFGTRTIRFETGRLARQAAGSATAYLDDETMVLSATTASKRPKEALDFFPLTVDVEERMYAAGRIPGSFFRREGRPSEDAILTCRLIDRPLRPSFQKGLRNEIQIVATVLALHPDHLYDVIAINAASMSTQLAGLPFSGPIGGVRVALVEGQWVAFPTHSELANATFDMVVAGRVLDNGDVAIMMVEAESTPHTLRLVAEGAIGPNEQTVAEGLEAAKPFIKVLCRAQQTVAEAAGKPPGEYPIFIDYQDDAYAAVEEAIHDELAAALTIADKQEREAE